MIKRETWKLSERPDSFIPYKGRPVHHEPAKEWKDLTLDNRNIYARIAKKVLNLFPEVTVHAFGSRIHGRWGEDSDYDVSVDLLTQEQIKEFEKVKPEIEGIRIDYKYNYPGQKKILIPIKTA